METQVKRAHFVPQVILRNFIDPDTASRKFPQLWAFDRQEGRWFQTRPANVAQRLRYYAVPMPGGGWDETLEKTLSALEADFARVFREKIMKWRPLRGQDRYVVAEFVAASLLRTPRFHDWVRQQTARMFDRTERVRDTPRGQWSRTMRRIAMDHREATGLDIHDTRPEAWEAVRRQLVDAEEAAVTASMVHVHEIARPIYQFPWTFLKVPPGAPLVTSDNPVTRFRTEAGFAVQGGLRAKDLEITMPLTPELTFVAGPRIEESPFMLRTHADAAHLNARVAFFAERYLISPKPGFPGADALGVACLHP